MDEQARADFTSFVNAHWASMFRTAYLLTGDHHLAEDLTQGAFTKAMLSWSRVREAREPAAYVRKIVVNQTFAWRRRRSSGEVPTDDLYDATVSGHDDRVASAHDVWAALLRLPPRERAVMVLRYYHDLSEAEIAETLGMARGTVKSHASAASKTLATLMSDDTTSQENANEPR
ncbi:MAG: SigE family RNA polymerase sigma factor [Nocardioidaceae bacterium]